MSRLDLDEADVLCDDAVRNCKVVDITVGQIMRHVVVDHCSLTMKLVKEDKSFNRFEVDDGIIL